MLELRAKRYEDNDYDSCGHTTVAVLSINSIDIPLCQECIDFLTKDIYNFNKTIFCYKCSEFDMSKSGWHYGGKCKKDNTDKECMDTCAEINNI